MHRSYLKFSVLFVLACGMLAPDASFGAVVKNKSSKFNISASDGSSSTTTKSNDTVLAEKIRAQRAALDAADSLASTSAQVKSNNSCDNALRKCLETKCSSDYSKCQTDTDIAFSDKLSACQKSANCTAHEFTLLSNQFKEDRKQAIKLQEYNHAVNCGKTYNECIIGVCGPKFAKCLSKTAGDNAIAKCKQIATNCTEADSGMAGRMGNIFGIVRKAEQEQIAADEKKLRSLRDDMRASCKTLGALFDERSLDCVFDVAFFAGDDQKTPKASKKLYAGSTFDCSPDWFGIDITTFKENAYRLTRSQTAASSAMLGSGVGTAVGAITSGAINRAIDTKKAKDELEDACNGTDGMIFDRKKGECREMTEEDCTKKGGTWSDNQCTVTQGNNDDNGGDELGDEDEE